MAYFALLESSKLISRKILKFPHCEAKGGRGERINCSSGSVRNGSGSGSVPLPQLQHAADGRTDGDGPSEAFFSF